MPTVFHTDLRRIICQTYEKSGTPPDAAKIISDHLVDANLAGHDSHGVMRAFKWYSWNNAEFKKDENEKTGKRENETEIGRGFGPPPIFLKTRKRENGKTRLPLPPRLIRRIRRGLRG